MRSRSRFTLLAALAVGCALASACSCGSSEGAGGAGAGGAGGAVGSTSASSTTASSSRNTTSSSSSSSGGATVDKNGCEVLPYPAGVPDGWVEWTDWSCNCRFYVPGSKEVMPAPIKWEACPSTIPGCRMMVTDWTDNPAGGIALFPQFSKNANGTGSIAFRRLQTDVEPRTLLDLAVDVDGPVRAALLYLPAITDTAGSMGCFSKIHSYQDARLVLGIYGDNADDLDYSDHEGAVGGVVDLQSVSVLMHNVDDMDYVWRGDKNWFVRADSLMRIYAMPWSLDSETLIGSAATDPEHLQLGNLILANGAIFWSSSSAVRSGMNVWDPEHGARPLIRWIGDATRGAGGLGTDGIDMVWEYGEGKLPSEIKYPSHSVMTAKFSTDPDVMATSARRLRSYPRTCLGCHPWIVGCGYAANNGSHNNAMVVRLSDGWSWETPENVYLSPFGLTCDEVFVDGNVTQGRRTIARIKLSELGPGMAPN